MIRINRMKKATAAITKTIKVALMKTPYILFKVNGPQAFLCFEQLSRIIAPMATNGRGLGDAIGYLQLPGNAFWRHLVDRWIIDAFRTRNGVNLAVVIVRKDHLSKWPAGQG